MLRSLTFSKLLTLSLVLVAAILLTSPAAPIKAADNDCSSGGSWVGEANPWESTVNSNPGNEGYQALYNTWNNQHNFGFSFMDGAASLGCSGEMDTSAYVTIIATPMTITQGGSSVLAWSSGGIVSSCSITQGIGSVTPNQTGSRVVTPSTTTIYTITCDGVYTAAVTVTVEPVPPVSPTATLTANPTAITTGQSSTLTWGSENATSCVGTNFSTGGATSGSLAVSPTADTNYSVTCSNTVGSQTAYASVGVTAVVTTGPDLTASAVSPTIAKVNTATNLSASIANSGTAATGSSFNNVFQVDSNSDHASGVSNYSGSASPDTAPSGAYSTSVSRTFTAVGTWYVRACADSSIGMVGTITETNESNNCGPWTAVSVTTTGLPGDDDSSGGSVTCNVNKTAVAVGEQVTYTAVPAGGATAPYAWTDTPDAGTNLGSGTTVNRMYNATGTYAMSVSATGASSAGFCANVVVGGGVQPTCPGTPTATISASPDRVRSGTNSTITWSAQNVSGTCTITGPGVNQTVTASTCAVPSTSITRPITAQSVYRITCTGSTDTAVVNLLPLIEEF